MPDSLSDGLARLDPQDRALLELSAHKGVSDEEIAEILKVDAEEVARRREEALRRLAGVLGVAGEDIDELRAKLAGPSPPWRLVLGIVVGLSAAVLALVIALGGGDDEPDRAATSVPTTPTETTQTAPTTATEPAPTTATEPAPEPKPKPKPKRRVGPRLTMEVLNDTNGRGTARLRSRDGRAVLRLDVRDFLEPQGGGYAVWLYSSPDDARRLHATTDTDYGRDIRLPRGYRRYRFVDVARAVPSLRSDHSGLSLLRVPISALRRG